MFFYFARGGFVLARIPIHFEGCPNFFLQIFKSASFPFTKKFIKKIIIMNLMEVHQWFLIVNQSIRKGEKIKQNISVHLLQYVIFFFFSHDKKIISWMFEGKKLSMGV